MHETGEIWIVCKYCKMGTTVNTRWMPVKNAMAGHWLICPRLPWWRRLFTTERR